MTELTVTRTTEQPPARVWALLADYQRIAPWNPNVAASRLIDDSHPMGVGALRQCDLADGKNWIRERVTDWREGESYTVEIYEGTMPVQDAFATLGVRPLDDGGSEAYMTMRYQPKMGVMGKVMDVVMMRRMMTKMMGSLLAGLDQHAGDPASAA